MGVPDRLSLLQQSQDQKRYDLIDNADKFELRLDVPGVKQEDIDIKIDDDKNLIVKGTRVYETETAKAKAKFKQMFSLEKAVDVDHFSATLKDDVLVVTAPKLNQQLLEKSRKIPIVCIDDGIRAATKPNLENKETKDKVKATTPTEDKSSKNDCVEKEIKETRRRVLIVRMRLSQRIPTTMTTMRKVLPTNLQLRSILKRNRMNVRRK